MARLILKSPYLKPNGKRSPGGYLKYKVYGYLSTSTKKLIDSIVAELSKDARIQELYQL